jgi:hypothetical protein
VKVFSEEDAGGKRKLIATLAWGDRVEVVSEAKPAHIQLQVLKTVPEGTQIVKIDGFIKAAAKDAISFDREALRVLKVDFVDVQQGDAAIIETPEGKVILIDGGDNQLFARYLASRFPGTSADTPQTVDCIVVTHGDADHFSGLTQIHKSEKFAAAKDEAERARKRLFIAPERMFHNGLVKRPGEDAAGEERPDVELLGKTAKDGNGDLFVVGLEDDPRTPPASERNKPFKEWGAALDAWEKRIKRKIDVRRLARPINQPTNPGNASAFDFLKPEKIEVELLGPLEEQVGGKPALRFLGNPSNKVARDPGEGAVTFSGTSASHTINGHSIVLRLKYGKFRALFAGDLNEQS